MIKEIQGLRAIAILMVLFIHIEAIGLSHIQQEIFNRSKVIFFTSTGVEIFFVLAGFFMMNTLDKFKNDNNYFNIVQFIFNKFKRLAPNMYFWSLIALIMSLVSPSSDGLWLSPIEMFKKFLSTIIFLRNFEEVYNISWFGIYWAISLELQVFIIFSICYFLLGKKRVIAISLVLCIIMIFYRFGGSNSWLFRFDPILWGVLFYEFNKKINQEYIRNIFACGVVYKVIISVFSILILSSNLVIYKEYSNFNTTISSLLACLMLLLSLSGNNYFYVDIKYIRDIINWLGSRSYSIFCCHIVVWFMVRDFGMQNIYVSQIISIITMSICAEVSYRFIENPYRGKN